MAAQPTRGLDIGASEYVHEQLLKQRRSTWKALEKSFPRGFLNIYRDRATSAAEGAMLV